MNQTLEVIHRRKSLRAYAPGSVSAAEKQAILAAAMRAPTAGNMMLYSIIEVADQAIKDRLVDSCDHQPFIATAPLVLLFVADYQRWFDYYTLSNVREACAASGRPYREPGEGDLLLAACDTLIAAQTAVIAAESLGIGSCYIGDILENYEIHRQLFDLPRYVVPVALLCFGRPPEARSERVVARFDPRFVVFKVRYHRLDAAEFDEM
jgi:FMN reductase (NADPH)/FMN reductase [NAD(P)H]